MTIQSGTPAMYKTHAANQQHRRWPALALAWLLIRLSSWAGSGKAMGQGIALSEGVVLIEAGTVNPVSKRETNVTGEP